MNPHIFSLSSVVPEGIFSQNNIAAVFSEALELSEEDSRKLHLIFKNSKIEKRHSVIANSEDKFFKEGLFGNNFPNQVPCTLKRNQLYRIEAPKLCLKAAIEALQKWGQDPSKITHVISVSCTGMYAPGLEFSLIKSLKLNASVQRLGINFMGCFGAFKGLAIAKALAMENKNARVLLVCTELCSLHFQSDKTVEAFVANALFADGAAAAIIGCDVQTEETSLFEIQKNQSFALDNSEDQMSWEIANSGMLMKLSAKVPQLIDAHIENFAGTLLSNNLAGKSIPFSNCTWAIHPGGKAIVEAIEKRCALTKNQTANAWDVLKNFGNMSSATFLFILNELSKKKPLHEHVIGLGFGPGLSIEGILLKANHESASSC